MQIPNIKYVCMALMFLMLVATAPSWLGPEAHHTSGYSAPWIYPGLLPHQVPDAVTLPRPPQ